MWEERPTSSETEEDLLRYQREFLASKAKPSAQLIRPGDKRKPGETNALPKSSGYGEHNDKDIVSLGDLPSDFSHKTTAPPVKKSRSKLGSLSSGLQESRESSTSGDPEQMLDEHDTHITKVLSEIVERDLKQVPVYYPRAAPLTGFPAVLHRSTPSEAAPVGKKRSLFAQQFSRRKTEMKQTQVAEAVTDVVSECKAKLAHEKEQQHVANENAAMTTVAGGGTSCIVRGAGLRPNAAEDEVKHIHEENLSKLNSMTQNEILEEQQKLVESLDPSLVAFLRSKQKFTPISAIEKGLDQPGSHTDKVNKVKDAEKRNAGKYEAPVEVKATWLNMERVEEEKLEWASDLPSSLADKAKAGKPVRFNLQGVIETDSDLPTHLGLHHHGDEPERPGYTLAELFTLARSANLQQRSLALHTLARIIANCRRGEFTEFVSQPVLPALLEGGVVFIVRWALDDSAENSVAAAVHTLHALLVSEQDEIAADSIITWPHGSDLPQLSPPPQSDEDTQGEETTDADLLKQDIVKGLLRMNILQRLRYILEVWRPAASVVVNILQIITRVARHSPESAYQVMQCPRLMEVVKTELLVSSWTEAGDEEVVTDVYGTPVPDALKLMRVIAAAGRNMAAILLSRYGLFDCVSRYTSQEPQFLQVSSAHHLYVEGLRMWYVLARFGLALPQLIDLYPVFMSRLQALATLPDSDVCHDQLLERCTLLKLLETVTGSVGRLAQQRRQPPSQDEEEGRTKLSLPDVEWNHVSGFLAPVIVCFKHEVQQFQDNYLRGQCDVSVLTCAASYLACHLEHLQNQEAYSTIDTLDCIENLCSNTLLPCLMSPAFTRTLLHARDDSPLLHSDRVKVQQISSLPQLASQAVTLFKGQRLSHPLALVTAICRLLYVIGNLHKQVITQLYDCVLMNEETLQYVRQVCQCPAASGDLSFFTRIDNLLQYHLISLAKLKADGDLRLYHHMALSLLTRVHHGDEHIVHDLMSSVIFSSPFLRDVTLDGADSVDVAAKLSLDEVEPVSSATQMHSHCSQGQLLHMAYTNLPLLRTTFMTMATSLCANLPNSRALHVQQPSALQHQMLGAAGQLLVPLDWSFLPLVSLYNNVTATSNVCDTAATASNVTMASSALQWLYLLESERGSVLGAVSTALKMSRLMCSFLAGSDLFLDMKIHDYLEALLRLYTQPKFLDHLDLEERIPGLASFYDLYIRMLEQYEAVSFGDALFGSYVMIPLQQRHSVRYRRAVWGEHASILRTMALPLTQLVVPIHRFLEPDETDLELISYYSHSLLSGAVSPSWAPLLYLVAVHHINRFIYTQVVRCDVDLNVEHQRLQKAILRQVMSSRHELTRHHVIYYKLPDITCDYGMVLYETLPLSRQRLIQDK